MSESDSKEHGSSKARQGASSSEAPRPELSAWETVLRAPRAIIRLPGRPAMRLATDSVRAKPAVTPQLSMMIGVTAIGLGVWGTLFPKSVKRTLGVNAPTAAVVGLFGVRELWSGFKLTEDPTRTGVLWARVGADVFDIAALAALSNPSNPKRSAARIALGAVAFITALDVLTAVRLSAVQRNCG